MENEHYPERKSSRDDIAAGKSNKIMRAIFGAIMVIVYVGMGVLLLVNYFGWDGDWAWTRYVVGIVLVVYGIWRAYRQVSGID